MVDSFDAGWCAAARILNVPLVEVLQADLHPDGRGFTWWLPPTPAPGPAGAFNAALARAGLPPVEERSIETVHIEPSGRSLEDRASRPMARRSAGPGRQVFRCSWRSVVAAQQRQSQPGARALVVSAGR